MKYYAIRSFYASRKSLLDLTVLHFEWPFVLGQKGSTIKINSIKYIKNYKLNENLIKKKINNNIF